MRKIKLLLLSAVTVIVVLQGCKKNAAFLKSNVKNSSFKLTTVTTESFSGLFTNEIAGGSAADPWVFKAGGLYWYCGADGTGIWVSKAAALHQVLTTPRAYIYIPPAGTMYSSNIWAPELHYRSGRWYVYFAADNGNNANHRMYAAEGGTDATDPLNVVPYVFKGKVAAATDRWAIDGHPFDFLGQSYFVWSGWEGTANVSQYIYIAKMSNPYTISGDRVEISRPDYAWEKVGTPTVNEGPTAMWNSGNTLNIVYSASGSWTNDYCLGRITSTGTNLMVKSNWLKHPNPVFSKFGNIFGPGHASFTSSPDGIQPWMVYHSAAYNGAGWDRRINIQQFSWENGVPYFGVPVEKGVPQPIPSIGTTYAHPVTDGTYKIRNRSSGQAIDAPNTSLAVQLIQWYDNGGDNQKWVLSSLNNGYYKIKSVQTGMVWDSPNRDAGTVPIMWWDNGGFNQQWRIQDMGNGSYQITNRGSLMNLDNPNSSTTPGTKIQQWFVNQYDAEQWYIDQL
jgi:GH43 family beta-xylosidase